MKPLILINAFEVPAGADEQFVAHWVRARDALSRKAGYVDTRLHRSLAPGARFRFVNIGRWASLQAFQEGTRDAGVSAKGFPFAAHPGLYEVIACTERLTAPRASVTLINPFEVPAGEDNEFVAGWERANDHLSKRPGYLATSLHRCVGPDAEFRFVNVARWASAEAFTAAINDPAFHAAAHVPYPAHPALYTAIAD
ncbi:MAG: antibiotic biosynthesis monooxygenase family protein [Solirubrobacteraceae bacterium]